jgi:hypothetical protein
MDGIRAPFFVLGKCKCIRFLAAFWRIITGMLLLKNKKSRSISAAFRLPGLGSNQRPSD